jgi:hypothetical protein
MVDATRAQKAETPKQPSFSLRLRASYFYPDCVFSGGVRWLNGARAQSLLWLHQAVELMRETHDLLQFLDAVEKAVLGVVRQSRGLVVAGLGAWLRSIREASLDTATCMVARPKVLSLDRRWRPV